MFLYARSFSHIYKFITSISGQSKLSKITLNVFVTRAIFSRALTSFESFVVMKKEELNSFITVSAAVDVESLRNLFLNTDMMCFSASRFNFGSVLMIFSVFSMLSGELRRTSSTACAAISDGRIEL